MGFIVVLLALVMIKAGLPKEDKDLTPGWRKVRTVVTLLLRVMLFFAAGVVILGLLLMGLCLASANRFPR